MPFVEVFASGVSEERKGLICEQLVAAVMEGEGAPDNPAARVIAWLAWQEASARSIGGQPVSPTEAPRYLVRISAPTGSQTEQRSAQTSAASLLCSPPQDDQPAQLYQKPVACLQVNDIAEGARSALGRPVRFPEITNFVTTRAHAPASNQPVLRKRPIKEAP